MTTTAPLPTEQTTDLTLVERAAMLGPTLAEHAARHDRDGTLVRESLDALRAAGLLAAAVPTELGGGGATIAELTALQRELGRHCGSTALASGMHQHVVAFTAWRFRRGLPGAEATLRKVADEQVLIVSTGGGDYTHPRGEAVKVDGGWRVTGHKRFASLSEAGAVMSTMFVHDDPEQGKRVLNMAVPFAAEGVTVADNWDTLGMRGTASNDVVLTDVFVPEDKVLANRPYGVVDGPLQVISQVAFPIICGAYLGVADSAYGAALEVAARRSDDPLVQRQVGRMRSALQVATWALDGALAAVGDDPAPSADAYLAVMTAKAEVARAAIEVCDLAMDLAGGPGFFKGSVVERAYRDVRAIRFHPLSPEATLVESGRHALGVPGLLT
ncbi:alkylation response protein AidB-like acyl-CoA dehydrogenase [Nocardioides thalensis]|uniref:Alkylation response protein AidB-like acyl-CoA dehydrogenase n=1 Tax=Nocardioides thalensis TaxID=1914755 RepID=A0A853BY04_9ACTN|nr:acyl-CoA dehydrogenase family protein [Nocardioides thalensis]NYJ00810.1 alkylation response protein AidB-like acyl-CoA dehydrogenase [Nocardioides thalensis]